MRAFSKISIKARNILLVANSLAIIAITMVAILFVVYHYFGVDKIFNDALSKNMEEKIRIAKLHRDESIRSIKTDLVTIGEMIDAYFGEFATNPNNSKLLDEFAIRFNLSEVICFTQYSLIAKTTLPFLISQDFFLQAENMAIQDTTSMYDIIGDKVRVVEKLRSTIDVEKRFTSQILPKMYEQFNFDSNHMKVNVYLMGARYLDPDIIRYLEESETSNLLYKEMEELHFLRKKILIAFTCLSAVLSILAIFIMRKVVNIITDPIDRTINAIKKIEKGELDLSIDKVHNYEMQIVMESLTNMAAKIFSQHNKLVDMNHAQRKMIESLKLSTGMLLVNRAGKILISNLSASKILSTEKLLEQSLYTAFPEVEQIFKRYLQNTTQVSVQAPSNRLQIANETYNEQHDIEYNIEIQRDKQKKACKIYFTSFGIVSPNTEIAIDQSNVENSEENCILITFDDMTEIISAHQLRVREDIARKVAHEVRNPLSPIQLSIERLEKKFLPQIQVDRETFMRYTSTISNRVEDIKKIIDDFVEFGQLAKPNKVQNDILIIIEEVILLHQSMYPDINYILKSNVNSCMVNCDKMQITQVFINVLKNAAESILSSLIERDLANANEKENERDERDKDCGAVVIDISLKRVAETKVVNVKVIDNGTGVRPAVENTNNKNRSAKSSGMKVGLRVVEKIISEHYGAFELRNCDEDEKKEYDDLSTKDMKAIAKFSIVE